MAESEEQKSGAEQPKGNAQGLLHKVSAASGKLKGKAAGGTAAAMKAVKDASLKVAEKTAQGAAKASGTLKNNFEKLHDLASEAREADKKPDKRKLAVAAALAGTFVVGGFLGGVLGKAVGAEPSRYPMEEEFALLYECLMDGEESGYLSISRGSYDELMPECVKVIGEFERQIPSLAEFKKVKGSFKVGAWREGRGR